MNNDEEVPYRSPVNVGAVDPVLPQDEADFPVILKVQKILDDAVERIDTIHVFDLSEGTLTIKEQLAAYKFARDEIIEPLQILVNEVVGDIKGKRKA